MVEEQRRKLGQRQNKRGVTIVITAFSLISAGLLIIGIILVVALP